MRHVMSLLPPLLILLAALAALGWFLLPRLPLLSMVAGIERWRAGLAEKTVLVSGSRIAYLDSGAASSGPPILLVHGSIGEKDNWNRVARYLTSQHRIIAVDLPGFGDSERLPGHGDGLPDQVAALGAIATALQLDQFHLGGNSHGARVAALYAAAHPNQVLSLWLPGPSGVLSAQPSDLLRHLQSGGDNPLFIRRLEDYDAYLHWLMVKPPEIPALVKHALARRALDKAPFHRRVFEAAAVETVSLEQRLAGLRTPTRIIWGERDRIWHPSGAQRLLDCMPRSSLLLLPDIGHLPIIEATQTVAADYLTFLRTL